MRYRVTYVPIDSPDGSFSITVTRPGVGLRLLRAARAVP